MCRMDWQGRHGKLRAELERRKVDAMIVTHLPNVRYLCGFTGSAGIVLFSRKPVFFTDGRYTEQASRQVQGARVSIVKAAGPQAVAAACRKLGLKRVAVESEHLSMAEYAALQQWLGKGVRIVPLAGVLETLRARKDEAEIGLPRPAGTRVGPPAGTEGRGAARTAGPPARR